MQQFLHPLTLNTKIIAHRPNCPCKGGGNTIISGTITKIINSPNGFWYYIQESGSTIQDKWIVNII